MLRRIAGRLIPPSVRTLVRRIRGAEARQREQAYERSLAELEALLRETVLPSLPPRPGRTRLVRQLIGTGPSEGFYLVNYLHESLPFAGDVCEFGVAQGATSALMASEIASTTKHLWLFDSFEGLSAPTKEDVLIDDMFQLGSIDRYAGTMAYGKAEVMQRLKRLTFPIERVHLVRGFIEQTARQQNVPHKVCFAYLDFDLYSPIITALRFLDERLSVGGCVVVDDYGFFSTGVKSAVDEFIAATADRFEVVHPPHFAGHFVVLRKRTD